MFSCFASTFGPAWPSHRPARLGRRRPAKAPSSPSASLSAHRADGAHVPPSCASALRLLRLLRPSPLRSLRLPAKPRSPRRSPGPSTCGCGSRAAGTRAQTPWTRPDVVDLASCLGGRERRTRLERESLPLCHEARFRRGRRSCLFLAVCDRWCDGRLG